jgi:hypothetical protein
VYESECVQLCLQVCPVCVHIIVCSVVVCICVLVCICNYSFDMQTCAHLLV